MRQAVLGAGFLEFLAGDHDGHGGFGDEVVGEGAEENTIGKNVISTWQYLDIYRQILPFEGASPTRSKDDEGWVEHVDLTTYVSVDESADV